MESKAFVKSNVVMHLSILVKQCTEAATVLAVS